MKVARAVHSGGMLDTPDDPKRIALIQKAVPGQLKVPVKAYLWGLRDSRIAAVNSEMNNQEMVNENLPVAQKKLSKSSTCASHSKNKINVPESRCT